MERPFDRWFDLILVSTILILVGLTGHAQESGKLRMAASQFPISANIDSNANWIINHMEKAKESNCQIIHFPECALSGYAGVDHKTLEEFDWYQLRHHTHRILEKAGQLDLWVLLGSTHRLSEENAPHNSLYLISPDGKMVDRYDKRFCTSGDLKHYSPGDHFVTFDINGVKCGLLICYDIRFPELYRAYKEKEVQVIFQSFYNARQKPGGIHPKIMPVTGQARAATNYFYLSMTNSSAPNSWPCHFITPDGLIDQKLPANQPGLLIADIDTNQKFYDASRAYRPDAIRGKLNSGVKIKDKRSSDRTVY